MIELNLSKKIFIPKFYDYIFDYSHRWEIYIGSAGSGKSYSITQKLIIRACNEKIRILVCRRYATTIRQTVFALFKEVLEKWQLTNHVKINESDYRITFPNGSQILFTGLDEETKLLSLTNIGTIWVEEAFEVSKDMIEQLNLRMRARIAKQQLILSFNPISKRHYLYDFVEENPPDSFIKIHSTFKDNPFLSSEYVEALEDMRKRNPQKAKIYYYGEWGVDAEGLVFDNWKVEYFENDNSLPLLIGMDFGFTNDISTIVASLIDDENKKIYIFKEYGATGKTNQDLVNVINSMGFSKSIIIADSAEPKSIEEIRRAGISRIKPSKKGADSIIHGIQELKNYDIIVSPNCTGIITELENYTWKKSKEGEYQNIPIDSFNHYIDALRYSLQCVDNSHKLKSVSKNKLGI